MKLIIFIVLSTAYCLFSQTNEDDKMKTLVDKTKAKTKKESPLQITFNYSALSAGGYYDTNGKIITEHPRTFYQKDSLGNIKDSIVGRYTFENNWDIYELGVQYDLDEKYSFTASIPVYQRKLFEKESYKKPYYDASGNVVYTEDLQNPNYPELSRTDIFSLKMSAQYRLMEKKYSISLKSGFEYPFGSEKGTALTSNNSFLNDGFPSLYLKTEINYELFSEMDLQVGAGYTLNGEDISNFYTSKIQLTYNRHENSSLFVFANSQIPTGNQTYSNFNVRQFPTREEFLAFGAGLTFNQFNRFKININYQHKVLGKNTWNYGLFSFLFGLHL